MPAKLALWVLTVFFHNLNDEQNFRGDPEQGEGFSVWQECQKGCRRSFPLWDTRVGPGPLMERGTAVAPIAPFPKGVLSLSG